MDTTLWAICNSQFLLIVQPLEHVALIYHCHASQCVLINFGKNTRTHTSLLTKQVATFLTMNMKTSTLIQKEKKDLFTFTWQHLAPWTLVWKPWEIGHEDVLTMIFLYDIFKIALQVGRKTCLDQITLLDQLLVWAKLGFVSLDYYWHSRQKRRSYVLHKQREKIYISWLNKTS